MPVIPTLGKLEDFCEFCTSLVYIASSRTARSKRRDLAAVNKLST